MSAEPIGADHWDRIIRPKRGLVPVDFRELWRYRELLMTLATRNILIRYKQTAIGVLWAVVQPVVTMIVFTVIFGRIGKFESHGVPYALLTLSAILPWQLFSESITRGAGSVVGAQAMVDKIYFPRLFLPLSQVLSALIDFTIAFAILLVMMVWYRVPYRLEIGLLPVFLLVAIASSLGIALFFSALNVKYRDVGHAVPFLIRIGMYVSPVGFMSSVIPEKWRLLYSLNPIVGVIDGFRWAILGPQFRPYWPGFWASLLVTGVVFVFGLYYFRFTEKTFADVI